MHESAPGGRLQYGHIEEVTAIDQELAGVVAIR